jgi:hypothetical protein
MESGVTQQVPLELTTIERLKSHAEPLVDTFDSVVNRAIDALEALSGKTGSHNNMARSINPASPPSLSFTTVHSVILNGKRLSSSESYWNQLLLTAIREAKKKLTRDEVRDLVICNNVLGKKDDNGYRYLDDVGISIQGQDANGAWKATHHILQAINVPVEIEFSWQNNPKAASPGIRGKIVLGHGMKK